MSGLFAWLFGRERNRRGASVTVVERTRTDSPTEWPAMTSWVTPDARRAAAPASTSAIQSSTR